MGKKMVELSDEDSGSESPSTTHAKARQSRKVSAKQLVESRDDKKKAIASASASKKRKESATTKPTTSKKRKHDYGPGAAAAEAVGDGDDDGSSEDQKSDDAKSGEESEESDGGSGEESEDESDEESDDEIKELEKKLAKAKKAKKAKKVKKTGKKKVSKEPTKKSTELSLQDAISHLVDVTTPKSSKVKKVSTGKVAPIAFSPKDHSRESEGGSPTKKQKHAEEVYSSEDPSSTEKSGKKKGRSGKKK
jgi:hypothetical protein